MSRKKAKDEIEVAFGLKQACVLVLFTGAVLGGTYFVAHESGHRRALRGEPSLLAFLEKSADPHDEPVAIPKVLLDELEEDRPKAVSPAPRQATPSVPESAAAPTGSEPATPSRARDGSIVRVKPRPAAMSAAETPPAKPRPAPASPPNVSAPRVAPAASLGQRIHYQVAALGIRKNAKDLVDRLRNDGFPARIQPANNDGLYRVYVGPFSNDSDAASAKARLTEDGFHPMVRKF